MRQALGVDKVGALGHVLRDEGRARVRPRAPRSRRAAPARLGRAADRAGSAQSRHPAGHPARPLVHVRNRGLSRDRPEPGGRGPDAREPRRSHADRGRVRTASGRPRTVSVDGPTLLEIVVSADLSPGLQAELPSAVFAATAGRPQLLLRLAALGQTGFGLHFATADASFSEGLFLATMCNDGRFPWQPDADPPTRQQALSAAVAALPAGSTGPFGSWATAIGSATYCVSWPSPAGNAPIAAGPLPDVPVLALSGTFDMRTPTANAASVVSQFPQGHLLVVPGVGHSVLTTDPSNCTSNAVRCLVERTDRADPMPAHTAVPRERPADPGLRREGAARVAGRRACAATRFRLSRRPSRTRSPPRSRPAPRSAASRQAPSPEASGRSRSADTATCPASRSPGTLDLKTPKKGAVLVPTGTVTVSGTQAAHGKVTFTTSGVKVVWAKTS